MTTITKLPLFYERALLEEANLAEYVCWDYNRCPHTLIFGATGSGKTYAVKLLLGRIALYLHNAQVSICDFKADDFRFLQGCVHYYQFADCKKGLDEFYSMFRMRQQGVDTSRDFRLLMFDEWASFLNTLDKKEAEAAKMVLATLLMLGRSFNIHVLISQQRADASYFTAGARDQFSLICALGNLTKESAAMFGFDIGQMRPVNKQGAGYMLTNGTNLQAIQVPKVRDISKLHSAIKRVAD